MLLKLQIQNNEDWYTLNQREVSPDRESELKALEELRALQMRWQANVQEYAMSAFRIIDATPFKISRNQ